MSERTRLTKELIHELKTNVPVDLVKELLDAIRVNVDMVEHPSGSGIHEGWVKMQYISEEFENLETYVLEVGQ